MCSSDLFPSHDKIRSEENAIALETDFHNWIHGVRLPKEELIELMDGDISELSKHIIPLQVLLLVD